ncbi:hypothetical protein EPI10_020401 [Gossypium australe]|uniref:Uncharacterized protein n=1 Tax=Gossypium australe TaxID=47621 RepID=A0A5B6WFI4_9ROSI|nr:hypothetical protein EPI10_020401 [Gossypium australe]
MVNFGDDNEDLAYPPSFTPTNTQAQPNAYPQRVFVYIRPQYQTGTLAPTSFPTGSRSNLGDNPANLVVSDLDDMAEIEKIIVELPKQLEDQLLPLKFKTPKFEKYNGTSCPEAHITMFCRRMTGYVNNDQLLIYYFQDSLTGHVTDMTPDRITLQNMKKKQNESFSAAKSFPDIVMSDEMIENTVRNGKIDAGENSKRLAPKNKENEVNNVGIYNKGYSKPITVGPPRTVTTSLQAPQAGAQIAPRVIIQKPVSFPYKDSKRVPWNYNCNVTIPGEENPVNTLEEGQDKKEKPTRLESLVNEPVTEKEANEFLKFLKHSEYSIVEKLHKQAARISVLALLLSLETYRDALMKVLNETYVTNDISVNKLDWLGNNISAENFIFFNDDEISPGGMRSKKALHNTTRCKWYALPVVLIDNGSTLNVLPLSTLTRLLVDSSHRKTCQNIVRAFDGTERRVMGRIEIPLLIGLNTYKIDFLVMDIKPSYNCLLGRPWIHTAGPVPSSLHQKLKTIHLEKGMPREETAEEMLGNLNINAISEERIWGENLSDICPYVLRSVLNNWTTKEIPVVFRANTESCSKHACYSKPRNINDMSDAATNSESPFKRDMCLEETQDFEDDIDCNLSPGLLRMVEQEEKQILPHKESVEIVSLEEGKEVKIGACIAVETKRDLIELL